MNSLLLMLLTIGCSFADKKLFQLSSILDDELLHELQKRLMNYDNSNDRSHYSDSQCHFEAESNVIIKTKVSLEQGAEFIDSPAVDGEINPRAACEEKCCDTDDCNLAVFKEVVSVLSGLSVSQCLPEGPCCGLCGLHPIPPTHPPNSTTRKPTCRSSSAFQSNAYNYALTIRRTNVAHFEHVMMMRHHDADKHRCLVSVSYAIDKFVLVFLT